VDWDTNVQTTITAIKSAFESHSELKNLVNVVDNGDGTFYVEGKPGAGNFGLAESANDGGGTAAAISAANIDFTPDTYEFDIGGNTLADHITTNEIQWQGTKAATAARIVAAIQADATISGIVSARVDGDDVVLTSLSAGENQFTVNNITAGEAGGSAAFSLVVNQDAAGTDATSSTSSSPGPVVDLSRHLVFQNSTNGSGLITSGGLDLLDSTSATSMNLADYTVDDFTSFIQNVATARAQNGAESTRLSASLEMLKTNQGNIDSARSRLADVDVALESTNLAKQNILVQSAAAMLSQANASSNVALQLLG